MPEICCNGTDEDFNFCIGNEITYSEDNKDYTIVRRVKYCLGECKKVYYVIACDPTNPNKSLQIDDESKMTKTDCLSVITKLWDNLEYTNNGDFHTLIMNKVIGRLCDPTCEEKLNIKVEFNNECYKLIANGIEFCKKH